MAWQGPVEPDMPPRTWRQQRASGPHGFAVRDPSPPRGFAGPGTPPTKSWRRRKQTPFVLRAAVHSRKDRPANKPAAPDAAASTASHPAFVTIAIRPFWGMRWRELIAVICPTAPADYFFERDWTTRISLESLRKSKLTSSGFFGPSYSSDAGRRLICLVGTAGAGEC
jgi:hypothetical protein